MLMLLLYIKNQRTNSHLYRYNTVINRSLFSDVEFELLTDVVWYTYLRVLEEQQRVKAGWLSRSGSQ
jgi:hypothetical protein